MVIIFELTFLCFVIYFLQNVLRMIKKERCKFFLEFWNILEFSMLILSLVTIVMYALKKVFGTVAIDLLHESESGRFTLITTSLFHSAKRSLARNGVCGATEPILYALFIK